MLTNTYDKIIIIGAGATGLALAQGLTQAGIKHEIYDKAESQHSTRNWDFGVHWGYDALKALVPADLLASLDQCQVDPHISESEENYHLPLVGAGNGRLIKVLESSKFWRLRRDKFRKWLMTGLDVHWGMSLLDITYSADGSLVTATFSDNTQAVGTLLVGCDGAHSAVRSLLLGPEKSALKPIDSFATAMIQSNHTQEHARYLRSKPFHPLYQVGVHPAGHAAWLGLHAVEDPSRPETWTFTSYISYSEDGSREPASKAEIVAQQKFLAKSFADPWKSLYEWISDDEEKVWRIKLADWDPRDADHQWANSAGRVTLAGDAAHPMSFQRGQGLNNALQDAAELYKAIKSFASGEMKREQAIEAYEIEMKARGGREVQLSRENTFMVHSANYGESHLAKQGMQVESKA